MKTSTTPNAHQMKTLSKKLLLLLIIICFSQMKLQAQTINIDAVNKYWELTDALKHNIPITNAQWDSFIAMEGNKTYVESEFTDKNLAYYRKAIELVYMPKNDSMLQVNLKAKNWYCILAKRYKDEEQTLKKYLADTVQRPAYFNHAYQYVYEYLPKKAHHPIDNLKLYYNCLSNDAVSYPNGLFFSLLSEIDNAKAKTGTLEAHELHHRLRPNLEFKDIAADEEGIIWAISAIQNEGIADMIDKSWELKENGDPQGIADWLLTPAPATIKSLDSCLSVMTTNSHAEKIRFYRNLLQGTVGHMPGFYMAGIIEKNGYKKQMVERSDNPFAFIYLYNKAAKKDENHPIQFSEQSIKYLKTLERKYK